MDLKMPELSERQEKVVITQWHLAEEDPVSKDQDLLEVSTDKATFDIPSPCDGILKKIHKTSGESVGTDEAIAEIQET
jgi:pyruvate/2-oxoglutarate dehydrogenase complex dihydrolipoamide acyltransferase (E2) component